MKQRTILKIVAVMLVLFTVQLFFQFRMLRKSAADRIMDFKFKVNVAVQSAMVSLDKSGITEYYAKEGDDKLIDELQKMNDVLQNVIGDKDPDLPENKEYYDLIVTEVPGDSYDFVRYDSIIGNSLHSYGIYLDYVLAFYDETSRKFLFKSDDVCDDNAILVDGVANSYMVVNSNGTVGMVRILLYFPDMKRHFYTWTLSTWINVIVLVLVMIFSVMIVLSLLKREKENSDMKTAFMNNMTHELKTPIATIKLVCEAMQDDSFAMDKETARSMVKMVEDENNRMLTLVDEMLNSVRIARGYKSKQKEEVDIHETINAAIAALSVLAESRNAHVTKVFEATDTIVMSQKNNMIGVFSNLIDNAIKYSPDTPEISVTTRNVCKNIEIRVSDKGLGISKHDQKKIFDQFFRADTGDRHDIKGYGIGLSYVKSVIAHCKGKVEVESELGKGSTFVITIPLKKYSATKGVGS